VALRPAVLAWHTFTRCRCPSGHVHVESDSNFGGLLGGCEPAGRVLSALDLRVMLRRLLPTQRQWATTLRGIQERADVSLLAGAQPLVRARRPWHPWRLLPRGALLRLGLALSSDGYSWSIPLHDNADTSL